MQLRIFFLADIPLLLITFLGQNGLWKTCFVCGVIDEHGFHVKAVFHVTIA